MELQCFESPDFSTHIIGPFDWIPSMPWTFYEGKQKMRGQILANAAFIPLKTALLQLIPSPVSKSVYSAFFLNHSIFRTILTEFEKSGLNCTWIFQTPDFEKLEFNCISIVQDRRYPKYFILCVVYFYSKKPPLCRRV